MSVAKEIYLVCEFCGEPSAAGGEHPAQTVADARRYAREQRGFRTQGGRDICADCLDEAVRP